MNFMKMAKQVSEMQQGLKQAKLALAGISVTGQAGRGAVSITLNGAMEVKAVKLDPALTRAAETAQLERWISDALADALRQAQKSASGYMSKLTGGLGGLDFLK